MSTCCSFVYCCISSSNCLAVTGVANRRPDLNLTCGGEGRVHCDLSEGCFGRARGAYLPFRRPELDPTKRHRRRTVEKRKDRASPPPSGVRSRWMNGAVKTSSELDGWFRNVLGGRRYLRGSRRSDWAEQTTPSICSSCNKPPRLTVADATPPWSCTV